MEQKCAHEATIKPGVEPKTPDGCEECLKQGDTWVQLRMCLSCGHIGCCDNSKNTHATKHFEKTKHPLIESFKSAEHWRWCYIDQTYLE